MLHLPIRLGIQSNNVIWYKHLKAFAVDAKDVGPFHMAAIRKSIKDKDTDGMIIYLHNNKTNEYRIFHFYRVLTNEDESAALFTTRDPNEEYKLYLFYL